MKMINQIQVKQTNLSPAGAYAIGQYFKNNDSLNRQAGAIVQVRDQNPIY